MGTNKIVKQRESGIELMRIIAIFLIMVTHACYLTFGAPSLDDIREDSIRMFGYLGLANISLMCVNVFVLISGWFGIKPRMRNVGGLIFQCVFFSILVQTTLFSIGGGKPTFIGCILSMFQSCGGFVSAYIVLCILAPVLNSFCDTASKTTFRNFLISYYVWGFVMGWLLMIEPEFSSGRTVVCFIGLYLLARYIRLYVHFTGLWDKATTWGIAWCLLMLVLASAEVILPLIGVADRVSNFLLNFSYSHMAPNLILASLMFFFWFQRIHFTSRIINWIAASAFSCVLLHGFMFDTYYSPTLKSLYSDNVVLFFLLKAFGFLLSFLIAGVMLDQIRIFLWNHICVYIESRNNK